MESNSNKQHDNSQSICPPYQEMSSVYSSHPQQLISGTGYMTPGELYTHQTPLYKPSGIVIKSTFNTAGINTLPTAITTNLRMFLIISGFIYSFWGILMASLEIAIVVNTYSTYYHGAWIGPFLIFGGIFMMVVAFRSYYLLIHLNRIYNANLNFCLLGFILTIINSRTTPRCSPDSSLYCDSTLTNCLKITLAITFILGFLHSIINKIFIYKEHQQTVSKANSNVANY
ncbi:unnamed protein product [Adineta steineri]|uniref:MARVEL domain-containing protein n=1 Tax=Adineta steineri TaxID=433720 RepID=A0A813TJ93_9BILA|nr:unnamed protein product [Adineta steineri]CAF0768361.1 unnamed protein product [Adineta steineri]CAF0813569.1 unnamed protein product [Adineta steineri]